MEIIRCIIAKGPATVKDLESRLLMHRGSITGDVLDHEWFEQTGGRVNITNDARQAVADKGDE